MGDKSPLFYWSEILIKKEHILSIANGHLKNSPVFVTGIRIGSDNQINVFIDGDNGVTIKDCVELSRLIEGSLDRSKDDFALDVSSHGAATPLVLPRQYTKHIGREFEIKLLDDSKHAGTLLSADKKEIKIEFEVRENKPLGKGKVTVVKTEIIQYDQIKESKVKLKY